MIKEKPTPAESSDEEVLALCYQRPAVFKLIVDRYEAAFLRKAREILGNREEVDDVVVETFTKIYCHGARFEKQAGASFKSWAYKILMNTAFSYYRKLKADRVALIGETAINWDLLPAAATGWVETTTIRDEALRLLARLPRELARLLRFYFIDGWSQREIARAEGLSLSAVKTRIHRAKKTLQNLYDR